MNEDDRRARIEALLQSSVLNHAELRALLLPHGEHGGLKPWLPNLPEARDGWDEVWADVGRAVLEAFTTAEGQDDAARNIVGGRILCASQSPGGCGCAGEVAMSDV